MLLNQDFYGKKWPSMTDEEKMIWKYQRYSAGLFGQYLSGMDNVGKRVLDYLE